MPSQQLADMQLQQAVDQMRQAPVQMSETVQWVDRDGFVTLGEGSRLETNSSYGYYYTVSPNGRRVPKCKRKQREEGVNIATEALQADAVPVRPAAYFDRDMPVVPNDIPF